MTMARVAWLAGPGALEWREEALPEPAADEIRCDSIVSVISPGTELAAWRGLPPLRPGTGYPRLQGYCNVARVVASQGPRFSAGDRVLSFTSHRDRFNLPGDDVLAVLPPQVDAAQAATAYLFHLGYNAVLRSNIRAGSRVAVIGLGALGLASVAMAALAGAQVTGISDHEVPAAIAKRLGAGAVAARGDRGTLGKDFADVVISTTNGWLDWQLALELAAPLGMIAVLGFPGRGEATSPTNPLDSASFYVKQLRIEAVGLSPEAADARGFLRFDERTNLDWLVDRIAVGALDAGALLSGHYPADQLARAYDDLAARRGSPVTFALDW